MPTATSPTTAWSGGSGLRTLLRSRPTSAALAEPLGLDPAAADQEKLIASVRAALQAREGWLLVFDNVEEPELPRAFLPTTGQGHVLITSRRTDWQGVAKVLELEVMKEGEALQLLTGHPDPDTLPAAERADGRDTGKGAGLPAPRLGAGAGLHGWNRQEPCRLPQAVRGQPAGGARERASESGLPDERRQDLADLDRGGRERMRSGAALA